MASWDVVKSSLHKLLPTLDLQSATERIIIETLEKHMGQSLTEHKSLIREEIDDFLVNMEEDEEFEDKPTSAPAPKPTPAPAPAPKVGAKRTATASAKQTPAAKRVAAVKEDSSPASSTASPLEPNMWEISNMRRIKVDTFQGKVMVSIREFYSDADGVMQPGRKGLSMPLDQYRALLSGVDAINAAVENGGQEGFVVDLANMRKVTVEKYKSTLQVGMREYYDKDGSLAPGKKGISLPEDQWRKIAELLPEVTAAVEAMTDGKPLLATPATLAIAFKPESGLSEETKATTLVAAGPSGGDSNIVELSNNRRASVEVFKNKPLVSVREFYQDSAGEWKPTQKGLSMNDAQWGVFMENASAINDAVAEGGKAGLMVELNSTRRVTVEQFKGGTVVSLREFYKKDDKMLPGKKGITLTPPQWQTLYSNLDKLQTLFAATSSA